MSKLLGKALAAARAQRNYTQQDVASALGVSRVAVSQWENGSSDPSTENLIRVCDFLGLNLSAATAGMVQVKSIVPLPDEEDPEPEPVKYVTDRRPEYRDTDDEFIRYLDGNPLTRGRRKRDVPVMSVVFAGDEADYFQSDEIIDFVHRPPSYSAWKRLSGLYAIYAASDALSPRYEPGEIMFLSPGRPPAAGDYIAMRLVGDSEGQQRWILRRFVGRTSSIISCETLTPAAIFNVDASSVQAVHRIMGWSELIET